MKVTWSPLAEDQVDEAVAYITRVDPAAALAWLEELLDHVESLARFPDSGRMAPELRRDDIREILVTQYRVMYRGGEDVVEIAAIRHEARVFDGEVFMP